MRKREKERIFKRFMAGDSLARLFAKYHYAYQSIDFQNAIRDVIKIKLHKGEM